MCPKAGAAATPTRDTRNPGSAAAQDAPAFPALALAADQRLERQQAQAAGRLLAGAPAMVGDPAVHDASGLASSTAS